MIDGLIYAIKVLVLIAVAIGVLAALPWVLCAMYENATADVPHIDEDYWLARGYEPLDASSTGEKRKQEER